MQTPSLPVLLAFKAITLALELRDSDRKIAGALLDHFNRKTGQCDPSLETIANLVGVNRRTVIRATSRLVSIGLFRKVRHGGNFHRNHYEPVWQRFEQAEAEWKQRRAARSDAYRKNKSPSQCQPRPPSGDNGATQTCGINLSDETLSAGTSGNALPRPFQRKSSNGLANGQNKKATRPVTPSFRVHSTSSKVAARESAHRRWDTDILDRFRKLPQVYARIVELIDMPLAIAATDAELKHRGSGIRCVVEELARRGLDLDVPTEAGRGG